MTAPWCDGDHEWVGAHGSDYAVCAICNATKTNGIITLPAPHWADGDTLRIDLPPGTLRLDVPDPPHVHRWRKSWDGDLWNCACGAVLAAGEEPGIDDEAVAVRAETPPWYHSGLPAFPKVEEVTEDVPDLRGQVLDVQKKAHQIMVSAELLQDRPGCGSRHGSIPDADRWARMWRESRASTAASGWGWLAVWDVPPWENWDPPAIRWQVRVLPYEAEYDRLVARCTGAAREARRRLERAWSALRGHDDGDYDW